MASMTNARVFKGMSRILLCVRVFVAAAGLLYVCLDNLVEWKLVEGKVNRHTNTTSKFPQLLIQENYTGVPCNDSLDRPQAEMMAKIDSYSFPGIERYIRDNYNGVPCHDSLDRPQEEMMAKIDSYSFPGIERYIRENYNGVPCNDLLDRPQPKMMAKIDSYSFPGIERYMRDLFPESSDQVLPEEPVFVTAFSSNHFKENLAFFYNFNKWINKNKNRKLFVYDIGLNAREIKQVEKECNCHVEPFPFDTLPEHLRILKPCSWKPIVIQLVARKHPFVLWMDPSVRFNKSNITKMIMRAKQYGAMGTVDRFGSIAYQTSIDMFRHLNEPPCLYVKSHEIYSGRESTWQSSPC